MRKVQAVLSLSYEEYASITETCRKEDISMSVYMQAAIHQYSHEREALASYAKSRKFGRFLGSFDEWKAIYVVSNEKVQASTTLKAY